MVSCDVDMEQKPIIQFKDFSEVVSVDAIDLGFESVVLYNKLKH